MKKLLFKSLESAENAGAEMKTEILHANFRAKSIKSVGEGEDEVIKISWYASTKDRDRYGDVVNPKAFKNTMETYMINPMLLLQHNMDKQIWVITDYKIDKTGLKIDGEVKYTAWDPELFDKITNGDLKWFSIWFRIRELEFIEEEINGEECWTLHILELELLEISVVTIPANPYTLMKSIDDMLGKLAPQDNIAKDTESEKTTESESEKENEDTESEEEKKEENEIEESENETDIPGEEETPAEELQENINSEKAEKKEFAENKEKDNIENEESEEAEKTTEIVETPEEGWTEESENKTDKGLTLAMLKKLLEPEMEKMEKANAKILEKLENSFNEKLAKSEKGQFEMLEGLVGIIESQGKNIKSLTSALEVVTSGKWFIYSEEEKSTDTREKKFLNVFENMKKQFN